MQFNSKEVVTRPRRSTDEMEDAMKSPIITKEKLNVDIADETMSFMTKVVGVLSALIGVWGCSCLLAGLMSAGPTKLVQGYISAITGF